MYNNLEVIIPTYNRAELLEATLNTICAQSAVGFDVIILDNASTDDTKAMVERFIKAHPERNIRFIGSESFW